MKRGKNENLGTAYLFYYASDVVFNPSGSEVTQEAVKGKLTTRLNGLVKDAMIIAKGVRCDSSVSNRGGELMRSSIS